MEIFDIIKSVIFGIVEGITEWLAAYQQHRPHDSFE